MVADRIITTIEQPTGAMRVRFKRGLFGLRTVVEMEFRTETRRLNPYSMPTHGVTWQRVSRAAGASWMFYANAMGNA